MHYSGTVLVRNNGVTEDRTYGRSVNGGADVSTILFGVLRLLDRAGVAYCILHGYERFSGGITSDVDCIIEASRRPRELVALISREGSRLGATVLRCSEWLIVLGGTGPGGERCFLTLDFATDYELNTVPFYAGSEVLRTRAWRGEFWVPAPRIEFGCYLVRTIAKGRLDQARLHRLRDLFQQDPAGCMSEIERHWQAATAGIVGSAMRSGDWNPVSSRLAKLQAELAWGAIARRPLRFLSAKFRRQVARLKRFAQPNGLEVVLLGPDGAGKSSIIAALERQLIGPFDRSICRGFAPPVLHLLGADKRVRQTDQPHALPLRSPMVSVGRAAYWLLYHTSGYAKLRIALARSTLVLNDRHFLDLFVDTKRYRYGGPMWLLRLVRWLIPKPDLVILLDVPAEVLQRRKQEVSFGESARQRNAYLSLVRGLSNGYVIDAARPLQEVADQVGDVILRHLGARTSQRNGLGEPYRKP